MWERIHKFEIQEKYCCQTVSAFGHKQVLIKSDIAEIGTGDSVFRKWENMLPEQYPKCKVSSRKMKMKE